MPIPNQTGDAQGAGEVYMKRLILISICLLLAGCDISTQTGGFVPDPSDQNGTQVEVVGVVDGDTIDIRYANGTEDTVRFLGVDTPEVHVENDASEWEGVTNESCLREYGYNASAYVKSEIEGEKVILVTDSIADNRGYYDRLIRYIVHDNQTLNEQLVKKGLARATDSYDGYEEQQQWLAIEEDSRNETVGAWSCN